MTTDKSIAFQGELMLLQWAESSTRGRTVTFLVTEEQEQHPFRAFTIKSGKRAGQRFMAVLVELDENDQPLQQTGDAKPLTLSQRAFIMCRDPAFQEWANERGFETVNSEATARNWMLNLLEIDSRSEIDMNQTARACFQEIILDPFNEWRSTEIRI